MLRTLAAQGEHFMDANELAAAFGKKPPAAIGIPGSPFCATMASSKPMVGLTEPRHSFASKLFTVRKRASQQVPDSLVAYHKEQERYRNK
jgi:hypothetical protein